MNQPAGSGDELALEITPRNLGREAYGRLTTVRTLMNCRIAQAAWINRPIEDLE